jgi:hypothetical protein
MKDYLAMPLDFETWNRDNLVRLVQDVWAQNQDLRVVNKALLEAWRREVVQKADEVQQ